MFTNRRHNGYHTNNTIMHNTYFDMDAYPQTKLNFVIRSGLLPKEQLVITDLEKAQDALREVDYRVSAIAAQIPLYIEANTLGVKGIFTKHEIDRASVPKGLYAYDIQYSSDTMTPEKLWNRLIERRFGTVITKNPLPIGENGYTELGENGFSLNPDKRSALREFQAKNRDNES